VIIPKHTGFKYSYSNGNDFCFLICYCVTIHLLNYLSAKPSRFLETCKVYDLAKDTKDNHVEGI